MTEEEAKTTICHRTIGTSAPVTRGGLSGPTTSWETGLRNCIGSACMAWRWRTSLGINSEYASSPGETAGGYCGLAGKP